MNPLWQKVASANLWALVILGLLACKTPAVSQSSDQLNAPVDVVTDFVASGFMGDGVTPGFVEMRSVAGEKPRPHDTDNLCVKVTYRLGGTRWAGVYWQSPPNNWGDQPGRKIKGASKLTFWAAGQKGGEIVQFKAGGINAQGKPYRDSFEANLGSVALTTEWKQYEISLKNKNLSSVIGAFAWIAKGEDNPSGLTFYLDDIRFE